MKNLIVAILVLFVFASCKQTDSPVTNTKAATYYGQSMPFGGDSIRSYIKTDINGNPSSIGVTFSQAAYAKMENANADSMFMLMLPTMNSGGMMSMMAAPFDHIEVDWTRANSDPSPYDNAIR